MRKKVLLVAVLLALVVAVTLPVNIALAATAQNVTITATPSYIAISNSPATWTVNEYGTSVLTIATEYWSNPLGDTTTPSDPVVDGECRFTITNTSTVIIDLTVNFPHFTGGDTMQNSGTGSGGVGTFGAYSYCTGMTYSTGKVVADNSGSGFMKENLAATTDIKWGLSCDTQTDAWTSGDDMTSTVVITATAA